MNAISDCLMNAISNCLMNAISDCLLGFNLFKKTSIKNYFLPHVFNDSFDIL